MLTTYTSSYFHRKSFFIRLLWLASGIALLSAAYHAYLQHTWVASWKLVLSLGCLAIIATYKTLGFERSVTASMWLIYGVIFLCMWKNEDIAVWMLTLPVLGFVVLPKQRVLMASSLGFFAMIVVMGYAFIQDTDMYEFDTSANILVSYAMLAYACYYFHKLIVHYRDDLVAAHAEKLKLQASRTLSAGVAHLINNKMQSVIGNASMLDHLDSQDTVYLRAIEKSAFEASQHANDLLAYADQSVVEQKAWVDITEVLARSLDNLDIPSHIDVNIDMEADLPQVYVNAFQLRDSVFLNVLQNAVESNPEQTIKIDVKLEQLRNHETLADGDYIRIDIKDDGEGIAEEHLSQVFDPFYTTKFIGRGIGLSAALGAVQRHGGMIQLDSVLGEGTTCSIWLPIAKQQTDNK